MNIKRIICFVVFALLLLVSWYFYSISLVRYLFVTIPLALICLFFAFYKAVGKLSPEDEYNSYLKEVLKTYDAVLINVLDIPSVMGRSIVKIANFEDLIDAQIEVRKPIYYKRDTRSTLFVLLDDKQVGVCILKVDNDEKTPFDAWLKEQESAKERFDESILSSIENTTIVKIDNGKAYRISPVRNKNKQTIKDVEVLEKTLANLPKLKDTVELSKTQLFRNLNSRAK